jgi:hypothetical protein
MHDVPLDGPVGPEDAAIDVIGHPVKAEHEVGASCETRPTEVLGDLVDLVLLRRGDPRDTHGLALGRKVGLSG